MTVWVRNSWNALRTLESDDGDFCIAAFLHDSAQIATGSMSGPITIWSTRGWHRLRQLSCHIQIITSLAFSHDSRQLASAWWDRTVKVWDTSSGECKRTFDVGRSLYRVRFDASSSRLDTERGVIDITAPSSYQEMRMSERLCSSHVGAGISFDGTWILNQGERVLWLPSEYRPSCSDISGSSIGIGTGSGRVWICDLLRSK